jgi:citrate lyase beta subunit
MTAEQSIPRPRRALLYMPGDDWRKINKAIGLGVDSICMDLEDGVALNRKEEARETILRALETLEFRRAERLVRINPVGSGLEEDDLAAVVPGRPDGVVIPKVGAASDVRQVSARIGDIEDARGWPLGRIRLLAIIETARGVVNLREIAGADPRLEALIFGAEDLVGDMGAVRTPEGLEVFYARSAVVVHAAAYGLSAIDIVHMNFQDQESLRREALEGARLGYTGKQIIHPNQVAPTQEAFTPTQEEIDQAHHIVEAHAAHQASGVGAFAMDGRMVDRPVVRAAEQVLARARAAGKLEQE